MSQRSDRQSLGQIIEACELFQNIASETCQQVLSSATLRRVIAGQTLFWQEDEPTTLQLVGSGMAKLSRAGLGDQPPFTLRLMGPGEVLGCAAVLDNFPYPATAVMTKSGLVASWPAEEIRRLVATDSQLAQNALQVVGQRTREMVGRLAELSHGTSEQRLAAALLRQMRESGEMAANNTIIEFASLRRDLADMTGVSYFTVSRVLTAWTKAGIISVSAGKAEIRNSAQLRAIASGQSY